MRTPSLILVSLDYSIKKTRQHPRGLVVGGRPDDHSNHRRLVARGRAQAFLGPFPARLGPFGVSPFHGISVTLLPHFTPGPSLSSNRM